MKKEYVVPTITTYDIRMEERIAATCKSYVLHDWLGDFCESYRVAGDEPGDMPWENCNYSIIKQS